jgi:hypothetical protein
MPESTYKYMNYLRLDYKGYYRAIPDINDIKATMDKEHAGILSLLCSLLDNPKIKIKLQPLRSITSNNKWKVRYILDGKCVFQFSKNKAVMFGNQERRICGSTNQIELFFPNEDDVKKSFALIGILDEI